MNLWGFEPRAFTKQYPTGDVRIGIWFVRLPCNFELRAFTKRPYDVGVDTFGWLN